MRPARLARALEGLQGGTAGPSLCSGAQRAAVRKREGASSRGWPAPPLPGRRVWRMLPHLLSRRCTRRVYACLYMPMPIHAAALTRVDVRVVLEVDPARVLDTEDDVVELLDHLSRRELTEVAAARGCVAA